MDNISADVILQQPIWNNCNFLYKGNTLFFFFLFFFLNWISSGVLYVKDLLDKGGNLKQLSDFSNCIRNKSNWLCEFKIISDVFKRLCKKYDFSNCNFINIQHTYKFLFYTGIHFLFKIFRDAEEFYSRCFWSCFFFISALLDHILIALPCDLRHDSSADARSDFWMCVPCNLSFYV